jgi:hypothetical protein
MKRLLLLCFPVLLFAQIQVDTVVHLPAFVVNGFFAPELNKLCLLGMDEHDILDCSTYEVRARIQRPCSVPGYGAYSWNWRRKKLYMSSISGGQEDSVAVIDMEGDSLLRWLPQIGNAGVYVGSTDRYYRPLDHIGLVGVDCATDTVVSIIAPPLSGYEFWRPSWDSVHNKLYVSIACWGGPTKVAVYDCTNDSLRALIDVPARPNVMNFSYANHKGYYSVFDLDGSPGVIDLTADTLIKTFPFKAAPISNVVALDEKDNKAYIIGNDTVQVSLYVIDCTRDSIIKKVALPEQQRGAVDFLVYVPWSNRVYLTSRSGGWTHHEIGMHVLDCDADSLIVENLLLGYWPPFDFQTDPIRERVFAIGCETTSVHVLRDVEGGVVEETPDIAVQTVEPVPTVVRGVLVLDGLGTRSELPERNSVMSRAALLDVGGRKVLDLKPGANDVSRLSPGVYFIREGLGTRGEGLGKTQKVVVTR